MVLTLIGSNIVVDSSCHPLRRFIWFSSLLAGLSLTIYQIQSRASYYFQYPTMIRLQVVDADKLPFPEITLCNLNPVNNTWLEENNVTDQFRDYQKVMDKHSYARHLLTKEDLKVTNPLYNLSLLEATKKVEGYYLFHGSDTGWQEHISLPGKSLPLTPFYHDLGQSVCFALNRNSSAPLYASSTMASGIINFFIVYYPGQYRSSSVRSSPSRGYDMKIITPGDAEVSTTSSPIYLEPGYRSVISMTYKEYLRAVPPHGDCDVSVSSRSACMHDCILSYLYANTTGCSSANREDPLWRAPCPTATISSTALFYYYEMVSNNTWKATYCPRCKKPCKVSTYHYTVSSTLLDGSFFNFGDEDQCFNNMMRDTANLISFSIFFTSTSYEKYAEIEAYNSWALLCDVGGALGLFIGATLLTLLEIADGLMVKHLNISPSKRITP